MFRVLTTLLLLSLPLVAAAQTPCKSVAGTWTATEQRDAKGTSTVPGPNLWLYTDTHYSITLLADDKPRPVLPALATPGAPTAVDKSAAYDHWAPLTAQAGTYRLENGSLITKVVVAKNQSVMISPETTRQCSVAADGTMTQVAPDGSRRKLVRVRQ